MHWPRQKLHQGKINWWWEVRQKKGLRGISESMRSLLRKTLSRIALIILPWALFILHSSRWYSPLWPETRAAVPHRILWESKRALLTVMLRQQAQTGMGNLRCGSLPKIQFPLTLHLTTWWVRKLPSLRSPIPTHLSKPAEKDQQRD